MSVFIEGGLVKVCLSDREEGQTAWVSGPTLEACVETLELRLMEGSVEWRTSGQARKKKGK